jgi:hypothetical protein
VPYSLLRLDALGKPRRLGLLGASSNKDKYFFSRPRRAFFFKKKIVWGLYEEMLRNDENRALGNWNFSSKFSPKKYFDLYFNAWIVANCKTRRSSPCPGSVRKN